MTPNKPVVLASTSPYRKALIERLGIPVTLAAPSFDERAAEAAFSGSIEALAAHLADGKVRSLADRFPGAILVGGDQIAEIDGERLGKPGTAEKAVAQLRRLAGREHRLITALAVLDTTTGTLAATVDVHLLAMRPLSDAQIANYVDRDNPVDAAGSYKVESLGVALFERISGGDFTAVIGMPLTKLSVLLMRMGVDVLGPALPRIPIQRS